MDVDLSRTQFFATPSEFSSWLAQYHDKENEVWLRIYKKSSDIVSVKWDEAIIEALAWGWIDGIRKANDTLSFYQRFTPRKPRSTWSKINRDHAERLIAEGRMQDAGLKVIIAAKADGRWDAAYAGSATMEFSETFLTAIAGNPEARLTFEQLNRSQLFAIYHRLQTAKKEETRRNLIRQIIDRLSRGETYR